MWKCLLLWPYQGYVHWALSILWLLLEAGNSGSLAFTAIHSHHKVGLKVREWP